MPTVTVPADEPIVVLGDCGGSTYSYKLDVPTNSHAHVRIAASAGDVNQGQELHSGRPGKVKIPEDCNRVFAKAANTDSPIQLTLTSQDGICVERGSPTTIDAIREDITVQSSSASLFDKFATFEVSANYSHQFAPSWNYIGEIGITIISAEAEIEIKAGDDDNDQMAIDSPMVFDKTEVQSFKLHDPNSNTPRIVGWYSGVDS